MVKHKRIRVAVDQYDDFLIQKVIVDPGQTWNKIRTVHNYKTHYRKHWNYTDPEWFYPHIEMLNKLRPGFVINARLTKKGMWIDYKVIPGQKASDPDFVRDEQFISRIYDFVISNIKETYPYAHCDWALGNIIIDDTNIELIDWDCCRIQKHEHIIRIFDESMVKNFGPGHANFKKSNHPLIPILQSLSETRR
tara:strand:+ start:155 stop:733 length:579 start_codon:yes stop_codon:yes gene_type:complete